MAVKDCGQDKEKNHGRRRKRKMTTKWNLINPDYVPPSDKFSAKEEAEGKLFFKGCVLNPQTHPHTPTHTIPLSSQVEKAEKRTYGF